MKTITDLPLHKCAVRDGWQEMGLAPILISRQQKNKKFSVAIYLVDVFALGVKDVLFYENMIEAELDFLMTMQGAENSFPVFDYEDARSIVLGGIEYAAQLGFTPHNDWHKAKHLIESERSFKRNFVFGKDGKPFYYRGPNDTNIEEIVRKITAAGGDCFLEIDESEEYDEF